MPLFALDDGLTEIPGVLHADPNKYFDSPAQWEVMLANNSTKDPRRAYDLERVTVLSVQYYCRVKGIHVRVIAKLGINKPGYEGVVLYLCSERFKPRDAQVTLTSTSETISKTTSGNADGVSIHHNSKRITEHYELVASFDPPPNTLDIVDIAAAAFVTTDMAKNYNLLTHTCVWYGVVIFGILLELSQVRAPAGQTVREITHSSRFKPGYILKIPVVNRRGVLLRDGLFNADAMDHEELSTDVENNIVENQNQIRRNGNDPVRYGRLAVQERSSDVLWPRIRRAAEEAAAASSAETRATAAEAENAELKGTLQAQTEELRETSEEVHRLRSLIASLTGSS